MADATQDTLQQKPPLTTPGGGGGFSLWNWRSRQPKRATSCETELAETEPAKTEQRFRRQPSDDLTTTSVSSIEPTGAEDALDRCAKDRWTRRRRTTIDELKAVKDEAEAAASSAAATGTSDGEEYSTDDSDACSSSSLSTVCGLNGNDNDETNAETEMLLLREQTEAPELPLTAPVKIKKARKELDVSAYMSNREMTATQERVNALTVVPNPFFCLYFLLAGKWLTDTAIAQAQEDGANFHSSDSATADDWGAAFLANTGLTDQEGCVHSSFLPRFYALPPLPLIAVAIGITLHAPFSFVYHWYFAHRLPPGLPRIEHWSRRLDHSFIHVISTCMAYGTSGSWDYFLANLMFNADCIYRQFKRKVRPRRNKIRIGISICAYTIPVLRRGDILLFVQMWIVLGISGWLFGKYPIGGWSHSAFHLVIALLPPLLMDAACDLPASQAQLQVAARCAVLAGA